MSKNRKDQRETALQALVSRYEQNDTGQGGLYLTQEEFEELLVYYYGRYELERTLEVAELAIAQFNFTPEFYKWKALVHNINLEEEEAMETLEKLQIYAPNDEEALMLRLEVLAHFEKTAAAREVLEQLQHSTAGEAKMSLLSFFEGMLLMQEGHNEASWNALREAVRLDPYQEPALDELLNALEFEHLRSDLGKFFLYLLDQDPFNGLLWYYLGLWYDDEGREEKALDAFDNARSLDTNNPRYDLEYADKLFDLDQYAPALKAYAAYFESGEGEESYETCMRIGRSYQLLGHLEEAREAYFRAISFNAEMYDTYQYLGECFAAEQKWGVAAHNFSRAVALNNHTPECWLGLAMCHAVMHEVEAAEKAFLRALEMDDQYSEGLIAFAMFLVETGREEEAFARVQQMVGQFQDAVLLYGTAAIYLMSNKRKLGLEYLNEALQQFFDEQRLFRDFYPEMEQDSEIQAMIALYRP